MPRDNSLAQFKACQTSRWIYVDLHASDLVGRLVLRRGGPKTKAFLNARPIYRADPSIWDCLTWQCLLLCCTNCCRALEQIGRRHIIITHEYSLRIIHEIVVFMLCHIIRENSGGYQNEILNDINAYKKKMNIDWWILIFSYRWISIFSHPQNKGGMEN